MRYIFKSSARDWEKEWERVFEKGWEEEGKNKTWYKMKQKFLQEKRVLCISSILRKWSYAKKLRKTVDHRKAMNSFGTSDGWLMKWKCCKGEIWLLRRQSNYFHCGSNQWQIFVYVFWLHTSKLNGLAEVVYTVSLMTAGGCEILPAVVAGGNFDVWKTKFFKMNWLAIPDMYFSWSC